MTRLTTPRKPPPRKRVTDPPSALPSDRGMPSRPPSTLTRRSVSPSTAATHTSRGQRDDDASCTACDSGTSAPSATAHIARSHSTRAVDEHSGHACTSSLLARLDIASSSVTRSVTTMRLNLFKDRPQPPPRYTSVPRRSRSRRPHHPTVVADHKGCYSTRPRRCVTVACQCILRTNPGTRRGARRRNLATGTIASKPLAAPLRHPSTSRRLSPGDS
jgi:hypothetical protein